MEFDKLSSRNLAALISFIVAKFLGFVCFGLMFIMPTAFWPTLIVMVGFLVFSIVLTIVEYNSQRPNKRRELYERLRQEFEHN